MLLKPDHMGYNESGRVDKKDRKIKWFYIYKYNWLLFVYNNNVIYDIIKSYGGKNG